jgi:polyisoprenyl-teichoic acid--peptidoglycan teichoic acid transferase
LKNKKWLKMASSIIVVLLLGTGVYGYSIYKSFYDAVKTMHEPLEREKSDKRDKDIALSDKEPFSVLMLGVDERDGDSGRSDTMIVLTVNPQLNTVKMLSIPRDTRTTIIGKGAEDKINHAYAYGGVEMSMKTVENFLDIPIDYYMKINMEGFKDIVDAVGGVTVHNDLNFTYNGVQFPKGKLDLTGQEALSYSRMRYDDPSGDFGRQSRQRQIIQAVLKEGASLNSLTNYDDIFTAFGKNVKTNLHFKDMVTIQKYYKDAAKNIEQLTVNGNGTKINGIYYISVTKAEKHRLHTNLQDQL